MVRGFFFENDSDQYLPAMIFLGFKDYQIEFRKEEKD